MSLEQEGLRFDCVSLTGKTLQDLDFVDCQFHRCTLEQVVLRRCRFTDCAFFDCQIVHPTIEQSAMTGGAFARCTLVGVHWHDLLGGGYLRMLEALTDCRLKYNHFVELRLSRFDFSGNAVIGSLFADCDLAGSSFSGCRLDRTEFFRCDLQKADFREAVGYQVDLATSRLKEAQFSLPEAVNLLNSLGILIQ